MNIPKRRVSEIVEQELDKELLIYDLSNHKAFCLNETSTLIWYLCDGNKHVFEISQQLSLVLGSPINEDFVWFAIDQFGRENLIVNKNELNSNLTGFTRREAVKRIGLSTIVALPLIASVISPTAVQAQSAPTCLASSTQFECCQGSIPVCNPYCEAAAMQVKTMCCSETAFAVFGQNEQCNSVCQCL